MNICPSFVKCFEMISVYFGLFTVQQHTTVSLSMRIMNVKSTKQRNELVKMVMIVMQSMQTVKIPY